MLLEGNIYLSHVVGAALMINTIQSLILKTAKKDPALVPSPALTTGTDMTGFFLVLSFGIAVLSKLALI